MLARDTLGGDAQAYLHGVAATSTPWLLTVALLGLLRLSSRGDAAALMRVELAVTAIYAITIVLSAPVHVVVARTIADRMYEGRPDQIAAPFKQALTLALAVAALVGAALMVALRLPLPTAVLAVALTVVVAAEWLLLAVVAGMCAPGVLVTAYGSGAAVGLLTGLVAARLLPPDGSAYLGGFFVGQALTMLMLLRAFLCALPAAGDETARLWPAFAEYRLLALAALSAHAAIWADKLLLWAAQGGQRALLYAAATSSAWFSVIPASTLLFVRVETRFYARFASFYQELLGGATLAELERGVEVLGEEARELVAQVALLQVTITIAASAAAPQLLDLFALPAAMLGDLRLLLVGAALQQVALCALLLLYYFDRRRAALEVAVVALVVDLAATALAIALHRAPAWGYLAAAATSAALAVVHTRRALRGLLGDTFQSQPYGLERDR